jgi:drug/metabolite transporter (DMT)-like permease
LLTLTNYALLAVAYRKGELSLVYPVSRGGVLLFIPILGYLAFGERVGPVGVVSFVLIVAGIIALQLPALTRESLLAFTRHLTADAAAGFALLAAAAAAGYTVWDKHAVSEMKPFTYFYAYTLLVALAYAAHILRSHGLDAARREWGQRGWPIVQVAVLNTVTYLLVLVALQGGTSSYVIAVRQLSVAFGALLGWRLLREPFGPPRRLGAALILGGSLLVGLAS